MSSTPEPASRRPRTRNPDLKRVRAQKYRDTRRAQGLCPECGAALSPAEKQAGTVNCAACRARQREKDAARRQKARNRTAGVPDGGRPWPGAEREVTLPGGPARPLCCDLDRPARDALLALWARYRDAEMKAGRTPKNRRVSRLIRDLLRAWHNRPWPPPTDSCLLMTMTITVNLDTETYAILARQSASRFGGNHSAALRALLVAEMFPRITGAVAGHRTY